MDYATVIAAMFDPSSAERAAPSPVDSASPARKLRDAFEPLSMHAVWSPLVHQRMAERGLDFFGTYVAGRACVLGEPNGRVVASAFAAFEPSMIAGIWDQARQAVPVEGVRRVTIDSTAESLRSVLAEADEEAISSVGERLAAVVDGLDATGRPLFSGVQSLDWPSDPYGRLWQATLALREHRGDAHVAAYIGDGFDPVRMNILTELWLDYPLGEYSSTRAWSQEATALALAALQADELVDSEQQITEPGKQVRYAIETRTDSMEKGVVDALGDDLDATIGQLAAWSQTCIAAGTFPPDPRKRAAG